MKSLLILVLTVFAFANGQSKQIRAYQLIEQDKRNVAPICISLFQTLRDLTDQAIITRTLVNPENILKLTGERLNAVLDHEAAEFTKLLGSDAYLRSLYDRLLGVVVRLITDTTAWVNEMLSDRYIVLSRTSLRRILLQAYTDAEQYDLKLKEHLKAALTGYVNGILNVHPV